MEIREKLALCWAIILVLGIVLPAQGDFCCARCKKFFGGTCGPCCCVLDDEVQCDDGSCSFDFPAMCWAIKEQGAILYIERACTSNPLPAVLPPGEFLEVDLEQGLAWQLIHFSGRSIAGKSQQIVARLLASAPETWLPDEQLSRFLRQEAQEFQAALEGRVQEMYKLRIESCDKADPVELDQESLRGYAEALTGSSSGVSLLHAQFGTDGVVRHAEVLYTSSPGLAERALSSLYSQRLVPLAITGESESFDILLVAKSKNGDPSLGTYAYSMSPNSKLLREERR